MDNASLNEGEIRRVIGAFLRSPKRMAEGASEDEIRQVIKWAEELKLKAALNIGMLRLIYMEELVLDLNQSGEVVMQRLPKEVPSFDKEEIEGWLNL